MSVRANLPPPVAKYKKSRDAETREYAMCSGLNPQAGLRDQNPECACCHGSELPIPVKGSCRVSRIRLMMSSAMQPYVCTEGLLHFAAKINSLPST